jgi:TonB family protein
MAPARRKQMFNNLIESSSHKREFKRRGSFFLFTVAGYALLFAVAGVASIYAYNAQLDERTEEVVVMLPPVPVPAAVRPTVDTARTPRPAPGESTVDIRRTPMLGTDRPDVVPEHISTTANVDLPIRNGVPFRIGDADRNSGSPLTSGPSSSGASTGPTVVQVTEAPPPAPEVPKNPVPKIISKGVITGEALELPRPVYPPLAKLNHIQGSVAVQVLIDEFGKVISAHAASGHAFLTAEAVKAAYRARFSPTKLGDAPVKVSGIITYNFVLN